MILKLFSADTYIVHVYRCILAKIIWNFDLELACPKLDLYDQSAVHMVWAMPKNYIRFLPRAERTAE